MSKKSTKRYLVRSKLHQTIGDFSEEEIIAQIRRGKFSADEEAALAPGNKWIKLSGHPVFYDALVSRALGVSPSNSVSEESVSLTPMPKEKDAEPELEQPAEFPEPVIDRQDATAQLIQPGSSSKGISESEIAALFLDVNSDKEPLDQGILSHPISDFAAPERNDNPAAPLKSGTKRRLVLWGGLLLLLAFLFHLGEETPKKNGNETSQGVALNDNDVKSDQTEDRKIFLIKSAEQALQHDSHLGYLLASDLYQKAIELNPTDLSLYDGLTTSLARFIEGATTNTARLALFEKTVKQGRSLESQRTSFFRAEGIVARAKGDRKKAEELLGLALETDSLNPENLLIQAEWLVQDKKFSEVAPLLKSILNVSQESIRANYLMAVTDFQLGNLEESWNLAQRVAQINPTHPATYA
ncbi:MAG: tetratricopeptide repeat protein, partial [Pseudomonadota bacterium]